MISKHHHLHTDPSSRRPSSTALRGQHRVFYWVGVSEGAENDELNCAHIVEKIGIPQRILVGHIKNELSQESSLLSLPVSVLLVVIYAVILGGHSHASRSHDLEMAISQDLEENAKFAFSAPAHKAFKTMYDVNSYADFYSWLRLGIVPLFLRHTKQWSEENIGSELWHGAYWSDPKLEFDRKFFKSYNAMIGGLLIRQSRMGPDQVYDEELLAVYEKTTFPLVQEKWWCPPDYLHFKPTERELRTCPYHSSPNMDRWLLLTANSSELASALEALEAEEWLKEDFADASIEFMLYNANLNALVHTTVHVLQARSGHFWRSIVLATLHLEPSNDSVEKTMLLVMDCIFIAQIVLIFANELYTLHEDFRIQSFIGHDTNEILRRYFSFWNFVEWFSAIGGVVLVISYLNLTADTETLRNDIHALYELESGMSDAERIESLTEIYRQIRELSYSSLWLQNIASFFPFVLMMRLFKAFAAQPRLAVVIQSMVHAALDIMHFFIVFMSVFSIYAFSGIVIFGKHNPAFSTFPRAMEFCFHVLMGSWDFEPMMQTGFLRAVLWLWTFIILENLIVLNMLLAMIMDAYTNVIGAVGHAETLCDQTYTFGRRMVQKTQGLRVPLNEIQKHFTIKLRCPMHQFIQDEDDARGYEMIKPKDFMAIVVRMPENQAKRLLNQACIHYGNEVQSANPTALSEATSMLGNILRLLEHFQNQVGKHLQVGKQGKRTSHSPSPSPNRSKNGLPKSTNGLPKANGHQPPAADIQVELSNGQGMMSVAGHKIRPVSNGGFAELDERVSSLWKGNMHIAPWKLGDDLLKSSNLTFSHSNACWKHHFHTSKLHWNPDQKASDICENEVQALASEHHLGVLLEAINVALLERQRNLPGEASIEILQAFAHKSIEVWRSLSSRLPATSCNMSLQMAICNVDFRRLRESSIEQLRLGIRHTLAGIAGLKDSAVSLIINTSGGNGRIQAAINISQGASSDVHLAVQKALSSNNVANKVLEVAWAIRAVQEAASGVVWVTMPEVTSLVDLRETVDRSNGSAVGTPGDRSKSLNRMENGFNGTPHDRHGFNGTPARQQSVNKRLVYTPEVQGAQEGKKRLPAIPSTPDTFRRMPELTPDTSRTLPGPTLALSNFQSPKFLSPVYPAWPANVAPPLPLDAERSKHTSQWTLETAATSSSQVALTATSVWELQAASQRSQALGQAFGQLADSRSQPPEASCGEVLVNCGLWNSNQQGKAERERMALRLQQSSARIKALRARLEHPSAHTRQHPYP